MRSSLVFATIFLSLLNTGAGYALTMEQTEFAVEKSKEFCAELQMSGAKTGHDLRGKFSIEANMLLKKLIDANVITDGRVYEEVFSNVSQDHLMALVESVQNCRNTIFERLVEVLDASAVRPQPPENAENIGSLENREYVFEPYLSGDESEKSFYFSIKRRCKLLFSYPDGMGVAVFMQLNRNNESTNIIDTWIGSGSAPEEIEAPPGTYKVTAVLRSGNPSGYVAYGIASRCR